MENKENSEKADIKRWSILNINVNRLPHELRNVELVERNLNIDDYSNWNVFQLNGVNPKKYSQYPSLYRFLSERKSTWSNERFLILQKEITPEIEKKWVEFMDKTSEILKILIENVKQAWWTADFYEMTKKYRDEIVSIFKNNSSYVVNMFWSLVEWYNSWEITEQDINELSQWAELIRYKVPENNMFFYTKWTDKEIDELKNKFLDGWSNIYMVR
jgi:hypothetical protein